MKTLEPARPSFDDLAIQKTPPQMKKRPRAKSMGVRLIKQEDEDPEYMEEKKPLHSCDVCRKSFSTSGNLSRHRRAHLDLMPFECRLCHRTFMRQYQFANHLRTHNRRKLEVDDIINAEQEAQIKNHQEQEMAEEVEQDDVAEAQKTPEKAPELVPIDSDDNSLEIDDGDEDPMVDLVEEEAPENSTTLYLAEGVPVIQTAPVEPVEPAKVPEATAAAAAVVVEPPNPQTEELKCEPCGLTFNDTTLFVIHRIFHSPDHPYKCGMCKHQLDDKYQFTLHLLYTRNH